MTIAWKENVLRSELYGRAQVEATRACAEALVQIASELTLIRKHFVDVLEAEQARKDLSGRQT